MRPLTSQHCGMQTWTDWRSIDIFHCLYEWLLGLLEDMLSQFQRHESTSVITASLQMIYVGIVGFTLCLATAARLAWLALVYCCNIGESTAYLPCACFTCVVRFDQHHVFLPASVLWVCEHACLLLASVCGVEMTE